MGNADYEIQQQRVEVPPSKPFFKNLKSSLKETLFPDDPFKQFNNQPFSKKFVLGLQYFVPILEWAPRYTFQFFKADFVAGITISSLAVPQGISYADSSFVPPLIYAMLGSSRDLAVGTVAVPSLLIASMIGKEVNPHQNLNLYVQLVLTATFIAGIFQASLGLLRLGFIVDFVSQATIVGFIGGAATVVCLQQLKGILGLVHFTHAADLVSVMRSVIGQMHMWRWESGVLGCCFLFFLLVTRYFSRRKPIFFWINALAPLTSVILASVLVYFTHAEKHGVEIEGIAVGRSFAILKNYQIDGNKEMIAFGMMNIAGSCTSCYLTTGPFSRTAVNFNAGCKTAVSNIVMATAVMITLLFLTPLFHYTPLLVLSAIIMAAMISLIDYEEAIHLWKVDKFDFVVCIAAYIGVVFGSVESGLVIAVAMSLLRLLLFVARPRTCVMGSIANSMTYRSIEQYPNASIVPGILILHINAPVYFANASYLRERYIKLSPTDVKLLVLANPGSEVMKKLDKSKFIDTIGQDCIYLTVGEAVKACNFILQTCKAKAKSNDIEAADNNMTMVYLESLKQLKPYASSQGDKMDIQFIPFILLWLAEKKKINKRNLEAIVSRLLKASSYS
ncbi:Sulfate transporter 3.1 [Forsythia ovata]|uniref:Sulfate transporter 3.1 n=1 Tax=Forsythia ovata TaxID=205694 RepID=A0ABD1PIZ0_9LAMI